MKHVVLLNNQKQRINVKNFFFSTNATLLYFNQCHTYVGWNWVKSAFSQLSLKTLTSDAISGDDHAYLVWQFINQPKLPLYQQQKIQLVLTLLEKALHFGFLLHRDIMSLYSGEEENWTDRLRELHEHLFLSTHFPFDYMLLHHEYSLQLKLL